MTLEEFKAGLKCRREFLEVRGSFNHLVYSAEKSRNKKHAFEIHENMETYLEEPWCVQEPTFLNYPSASN